MVRVDAIDERIVACLTEDARMSFAECGDRVGLSASAVKRRVDALREAGVILGFTVVVDPAAADDVTEAFLELHCQGRVRPDDIRRMVEDSPEVVAAYTVTGDADAFVHIRTRTIAELENVIERIRNHRDTDRTKSIIVLSRLLDRRQAIVMERTGA